MYMGSSRNLSIRSQVGYDSHLEMKGYGTDTQTPDPTVFTSDIPPLKAVTFGIKRILNSFFVFWLIYIHSIVCLHKGDVHGVQESLKWMSIKGK